MLSLRLDPELWRQYNHSSGVITVTEEGPSRALQR